MAQKKLNKKLKWGLWITGGLTVGFVVLFFGLACLIILMAGGNKMIEDQKAQENCESEAEMTSTVNIQNSADMAKNAKNIYTELVKNGCSPEGACALLGCWQLESNLNPKAVNSSSGATGIAQWLGPRLTKLQSFASGKAKPHTDLGTQVEFALQELNDPYYAQSKKASQSNDLAGAVRTIVMNYEGLSCDPSQQFLEQRTRYAQNWYGKFKGDKITSSIVSSASDGDNAMAQVVCDPEGSLETVGGSWCWPSPSHGSFASEQTFGYSSFRQGNFHDGLDFGSAAWPSNKILACHGGTVVFAGDPGSVGIDNSYPNGLGKAVVVVQDGDMQFVYQEFGSSTSAIKVHKGQKVKAGQLLAIRDNAHMHLGITKKNWVEAEGHAFSNDGTWLDPQKLIQEGMNKK